MNEGALGEIKYIPKPGYSSIDVEAALASSSTSAYEEMVYWKQEDNCSGFKVSSQC
jgi:hypothetical protein